jgi:hypothetical protein
MKALIVAIALALMLASGSSVAQTGGDATPKPVGPGTVRITTKAPEPDKWDAQKNANGTRRVFKCKPLACSSPQTVSFIFSKSPAKTPNPEALEKFAKIDLPKSIRAAGAAREVLSDGTEKIETLSSKTATLKGYPSVVNESKFSRGETSSYIQTAIIFAGPVMIRVQSSSPSQELALKALDQFVEIMRIEEGPPAPPEPSNSRTRPKTQDL